jgi:hypothetical protein
VVTKGIVLHLLAWSLGIFAALLIAAGIAFSAAVGFFGPIQTIYFTAVLYAIVGSLIASRQPRNPVGWLMIAVALLTGLSVVPFDLGDWVTTRLPQAQPLGIVLLWLASWLWIIPFGTGFPLTIVRFPTGRVTSLWWTIDVLSVAGTILFALAMAARPGPLYPLDTVANPFGLAGARPVVSATWTAGLAMMAAAYVLAVTSLTLRLHRAHGDEQQQLKWIGAAALLMVGSFAFCVLANVAYHVSLLAALVPLSIVSLTVPVAFGVAMLRYRLYDIDLIINRAFVYGGLTAVLAGLYTVVIALSQRLFVIYTGQRSDAAVLVTAFLVATAFTPVKGGLETMAMSGIARRDPVVALRRRAAAIESVLAVVDTRRLAQQVVDDSVALFGAEGAQLYVTAGTRDRLFHARGHIDGPEAVVPLSANGRVVGRLELGSRRGNTAYSDRELAALRALGNALGEVFSLAAEEQHSDFTGLAQLKGRLTNG